MDVAPIAETGRSQLIVVDQRGEGRPGIRARVLEWTGAEGFRTLYDTSGRYLRVARVGAENWLLEQDAAEDEPFEPEIRRLVWEGDRFRDTVRLRIPRGVSVYGLALMRLTGAAGSRGGRLRGRLPADRLDRQGAAPLDEHGAARGLGHHLRVRALGRAPAARPAWTPRSGAHRRPDRAAGGGHPGPAEILVYENILPALQQGRGILPRLAATLFNRGRIHRLRWKDGAFVRIWQSGVTEGYIADFAYGDIDGDGLPEVVVGVVPRGFDLETLNPLGRLRGRILVYELP